MRRIVFILFAIGMALNVAAQPQARRNQGEQQTAKSNANNITTRAQIAFPTTAAMSEDVVWRRDIYRELNLEDDANLGVEIKEYIEQVEEEVVEEEAIPFQLVETKPGFMGGDANAFSKWVNERLQYPEIAKENGIQGRVLLQFVVGADGSVSNVKVVRGVDPSLDKEAVRVVQSSPKWSPGKQRDRAVKVTYTFPVIFQLR